MKKLTILFASAVATIYVSMYFIRASSKAEIAMASLTPAIQTLRMAQAERFQSELRFADSNAEAAQMFGGHPKLGRIEGAAPVVELNVRPGGVIELLQDERDRDGQRLRAILLPVVEDPPGGAVVQWQCLSANWEKVTELKVGGNCRFDKAAWESERRHVARLRDARARMEQAEEQERARRESDRARADFERQRAQLQRESDRAREEEARQLARFEREVERARIENELRRRP